MCSTDVIHCVVYVSTPQAGSEGSMLIGLVREGRQTMTEHQKNPPADTVPGTIACYLVCVQTFQIAYRY